MREPKHVTSTAALGSRRDPASPDSDHGRHRVRRTTPGQRLGPEASVVISRRTGVDTSDVDALASAFEGCEVVAHCAGINREIGDQTYQRVHIEGTANVIEAAKRAGVRKVIMLSFLRRGPTADRRTTSRSGRPKS